MGMIGRWIDSQDAAAKDRIITHPDPTYDGNEWWSMDRDCGCLVGCAIGQTGAWAVCPESVYGGEDLLVPIIAASFFSPVRSVGIRFYRLARRFGAPRMWRVCKTRAARGNRIALPAVTEEASVAV